MNSKPTQCALCQAEIPGEAGTKPWMLETLKHLKWCSGFNSNQEREETIEMVIGFLELLSRARKSVL